MLGQLQLPSARCLQPGREERPAAPPRHCRHAPRGPGKAASEAPASPQRAQLLRIQSRSAGPSLPPSPASFYRAELNRAWWVLPFTLGGEEQMMQSKE